MGYIYRELIRSETDFFDINLTTDTQRNIVNFQGQFGARFFVQISPGNN